VALNKENQSGAVLDPGGPAVLDLRRLDDSGVRKESWMVAPRHEWVLIRQYREEEKKTDGGVIAPGEDFFMMDKGKPKSQRGIVVAVSEKIHDLMPGDVVIFTNFPIDLEDIEELTGDKELKLVRDEEVYAKVKRCT
jgi:co-chaperonin GroES (HSP10)